MISSREILGAGTLDSWRYPRRINFGMSFRPLPGLFFTFFSLVLKTPQLYAEAQSVGITCYGFDGEIYVNNTLCPGSSACCGVEATCLSNHLCHNKGDGLDHFVRGPCAILGWASTCAQVCLYSESEASQGFLPRVTVCDDGSLCCNNNPTCCGEGAGVFLDQDGNIASKLVTAAVTSYPPVDGTGTDRFTVVPSTSLVTTTSSPAIDTTSGSGSAASSTPPIASPSPSSSNSGNDASLKIGLGLGITLTAVVVGCLAFFIPRWWKRRKRHRELAVVNEGNSNFALKSWEPARQDRAFELYNERDQQQFRRVELAG